ncbi:Protein CBG12208 [Caenorhabditis briggsae]|uniref:Protein CBG12208 n=1 Tax=Caenorhabditis briggsae TaxID=6238 RepID=A8XEZ8_CAEBR|nr:Protein CBG12208 [Caenorhabditis briggsae]CAP31220.2 Protein CBG12208 [Caenorhabditis briggsae]
METNSTFLEEDESTFMSISGILDAIEGSASFEWIRTNSRHLVPIFCFVGIMGNSMALILIRTNFWLKRLTSNIYLCTLSITSCSFLLTVVISWSDTYLRLPLYSESELGCKFVSFLAHFSDFICVWMISLISCDRMIVLYRPRIRKWVCTRKFAITVTSGFVVTSVILYSWLFALAGLQKYKMMDGSERSFCGLSEDVNWFGYKVNENYMYFIFTVFDTVICTLIPSILIIIVNSFSTYRYHQCMKIYTAGVLRVRFVRAPTTEQQAQQLDDDTIQFEDTKKYLLSTDNTNSNNSTTNCGKLRSSDLQLSRSLIIVTSTFVAFNVPSYAMRIVQPTNEKTTQANGSTAPRMLLLENRSRFRSSIYFYTGFHINLIGYNCSPSVDSKLACPAGINYDLRFKLLSIPINMFCFLCYKHILDFEPEKINIFQTQYETIYGR